ncbi:hypothetical protein OAS39_00795 [Pirellulales bacterium]|nr:hypothetical protein [Pirellulales bacterium]
MMTMKMMTMHVKKLALGVAAVGWLGLAPSLNGPPLHAAITVEVEPVLHRSLDGGNGERGCDPVDTAVNDLTTTNPFERIPNVSSTDVINGIPGVIRHGDDGIGSPPQPQMVGDPRPFWAGNLPKMTDGLWSENNNDDDNTWDMAHFPLDIAGAPAVTPRLLQWDLGEVKTVTEINAYTRHCNTRSAQIHIVYGSDAEVEPDVDIVNGDDPLLEDLGWTFIGLVDSQDAPEFDPGDPEFDDGFPSPGNYDGFTGSSVFDDAGGSLGDFRYILFHILSVGDQEEGYVEFDVVVEATGTPGDHDGDDDVDGIDLLGWQQDDPSMISVWEANFGTGVVALSAAAAVPEPATVALSLLAVLAWMTPGRRRRH